MSEGSLVVRDAISRLMTGQNLSRDESRIVMNEIMENRATDAQISAYLVALRMKGETADEIAGSAAAIEENTPQLILNQEKIVDISGTGGDNLNTFNISTSAAIVSAGAGIIVAKHGQRSITSKCGSADILRAFGVNIEMDEHLINQCLSEIGLAFIFAPNFQTTQPYARGPRREIGARTILNVLSAFVQPARIKRQVIGVYDETLMLKLIHALKELNADHVMVVHGEDGLDEITISGSTRILELKDEQVREYTIRPEDFGMLTAPIASIQTENCEQNKQIMQKVLDGKKGAALDVVLLNAAAAILVSGEVDSFHQGIELARESVMSGNAGNKLEQLIKISH